MSNMSKNLLQDMKRTKLPTRQSVAKPDVKSKTIRPIPEIKKYNNDSPQIKKKGSKRYVLWIVVLISVTFFLFALSFLFSKAVITIEPKVKNVVLNEKLSASKDAAGGALSFDSVIISGEESKTVKALEMKDVSTKSKGVAVIYNAFSSSSQTLAVDTKLEGSNGKIYKTGAKVTIPGMAKNGIPGKIEVNIYAPNAGVEYNSVPLDFKVASFKGTQKYTKIYGRSKGEIAGGFSGKVNQISESDRTVAITEMKVLLQDKLFKKAIGQIPSGFILFKDAIFLNVDDGTLGAISDDGKTSLTLKGTLYGFLFNETKLTRKIVEDVVPDYDESDVYIPNIKNLKFSLANRDVALPLGDIKNINFDLSGSSTIVWKFNEDKFITDIMGKSKSEFNQILSQYPNIGSANSTISPFWRMSFPETSKKIQVIVNYPE